MTANQEMTTRGSATDGVKAGESSSTLQQRERQAPPLVPQVDIFEDAHQITVQAEMPGVSKEGLNVQAERNQLLIEGEIALHMPAGMSALYADLQTTKYRRSFVLSGELDTENIAAILKEGLLTVRIPKRVEFRRRKIKVESA